MDIEQPASFYLGREYDLANRTVQEQPILYDARDLTTHGVVVGMTGSGKTGLFISLLEEAAIDGIPCILIDPKGDLTNLLLQFPELRPEDFQRWLDPEDARGRGVTLEEHARQLAERWRQGLADSYQSPERIRRLGEAADWAIYTPGSEAGLPLSILKNFAAPQGTVTREALNQKIDATATALLGLTGLASDPVQSREHILIAQLLLHAWSRGQDLDLPQLITQIQVPPLRKIGAFDVDTFYPEKDRLKLAVSLNNLLAAPSFSTWITGEGLDLGRMLASPGGKPRNLIFYIAHLEDSQRMFFLTLLLEEVLSWTRKQQGTGSLRAILYFDEVFGYLPPHPANPPTKAPLMTLLKQARAFGVGVLLATQNPVDLDYKALSNAGTWFVGKLQTENDKARLIEGLEGVAAERGTLADRGHLETVISALGNRIFLLHDVHRPKPLLFQTRWALSFLRGPMTREQVALLMQPIKERMKEEGGGGNDSPVAEARRADEAFKGNLPRGVAGPAAGPVTHVAPVLPADLAQLFLALVETKPPPTAELVYEPRLLGFADVTFISKKPPQEHRRSYRLLAEPAPPGQAVAWHTAELIGAALAAAPQTPAHWADVPEGVNAGKKLKALEKSFADFLHGHAKLTLLHNRPLALGGEPGEDIVAFRLRCQTVARQQAEQALAGERPKYRAKFAALQAQLPEERPQPAEADQSVFGWFNPFRLFQTPEPPPKQAASKEQTRQRTALHKLEAEWQARQAAIYEKWQRAAVDYNEVLLKPRRTDIRVTHFGLAWAPYWRVAVAGGRVELRPAYLRSPAR
jgi:hypothetical protein